MHESDRGSVFHRSIRARRPRDSARTAVSRDRNRPATSARPGRTTALTVTIDRENGVDIATCERIAARINVALDAFPDEYTLEVELGRRRPPADEAGRLRPVSRAQRRVHHDARDRQRENASRHARPACAAPTSSCAPDRRRSRIADPYGGDQVGESGIRHPRGSPARETREAEHAMNAEMIAALREIENERNISFESLLEALESALISAYKRNFGPEANAIVAIDRQTGDYKVYHRRIVVDEVDRSQARDLARPKPARSTSRATSTIRKSRPKISAASPRRPRSKSSCSASVKPSATRSTTPIPPSCTTS